MAGARTYLCGGMVAELQQPSETRAGTCRQSGADFGMFAATVCVQVMRQVFGTVQILPPPLAEACRAEALGCEVARGHLKRVLAHVGSRALILACFLP